MTWKTIGGRRVNVRSKKKRHLYSNRADRAIERREFTEEYGPEKGPRVYGAVVGKVRREQAEAGTRPHREVIKAHTERTRSGRRVRVRESVRYI
jgi:hypothetical protein